MKNKNIAALLAFFVGSFGLHWFYLGKWKRGLLYLLFFWAIIPAFLGIIDCIRILLMSVREFQIAYGDLPITSIFRGNLYALPNKDCEFLEIKDAGLENERSIYSLKLPFEEFELFNYLQIAVFNNGYKNVTFWTSKFHIPSTDKIARLVKILVSVYGPDDTGNAELERFDLQSINNGTWAGRVWLNKAQPVMLSYDNDQYELTVMGLKHQRSTVKA